MSSSGLHSSHFHFTIYASFFSSLVTSSSLNLLFQQVYPAHYYPKISVESVTMGKGFVQQGVATAMGSFLTW